MPTLAKQQPETGKNMNDSKHVHKWECLRTDKLICHRCNTVAEIDTLITNNRNDAYLKAKVDILSKQLYAGDLKKDAREKAYAWLMEHSPDAIKKDEQVSLL
jgi:hypothetical protein